VGTIYNTSMYCAMDVDKTIRDAANQDSDAGISGHLIDKICQVVIQINEKTT
jgi:hypothetical protein